MADKILNVRIQTRTDTEANWKSKNPVLLKGEVGITSDNKRYKVGDGTTAWSSLAYATLGWSDITDKPSSYPPSEHTHAISDVTNLQATLNAKAPSTGSTNIKTLASTITLGTGDAATIEQANGTYRQRIKIIDNSTANDEVFGFYQSADSGSTYTDLFSIRDDGVVVAKTFSGGLSGNATTMSYPQGFANRRTAATWGNQDGTVLTDWRTSNGGDIAFRENGGQLNVVTDGYFYQNEGRYKCLDTNNYSSYALPLSGGTMGGTAFISWPDTGNWGNSNKDVTFPVSRGGLKWSGQSNGVQLYAEETANDNLELILKFTDDNSNGLSIRNASGTTTARITATGTFTGNASTATKATQDSAGQQINTTYIKGLSVNGKTITFTKGNGSTGTITTQDTTYSAATTSANGLMSAADKKKLDGIAEGANKITVDSALSSTSTNPVQNKVVNTALGTKASMVTLSASANLNDITTPGFYNCGGGNSITNKPSGLDAIGLIVVHNAAGNYYTQILTNSTNANTYRRTCLNGTWSAWTQDKYTDTNTWRGIQDNLTSTSTTDSLSANQGKVLATKISDHTGNKSNPHSVTKAQVGLKNVANYTQIIAISGDDYYGMGLPDGTAIKSIRTTSDGLLPYQSGLNGSGHSSLGSSTWYFKTAYIDNIFDSTGKNIKANYVHKIDSDNGLITYTMGDGSIGSLSLGSVDKIINVALSASGWTQDSTTGRYTQSVSNSELKSTYNAICASRADSSWNSSTLKAYNKAFGIVSQGTATITDGAATFSVMKQPSVDITVALYCSVSSDALAADSSSAVSKDYVDNQLAAYERSTYADLETAKTAATSAADRANAAISILDNLAYVSYTVTKTI